MFADIYRLAEELRQQHGNDAMHVASEKATACFERGDLEGFKNWNLVCAALVELQRRDQT